MPEKKLQNAQILRDFCQKNIFPDFFLPLPHPPSPTPMPAAADAGERF